MKAISLYIKFQEAFFRTHITKAFGDTYLIPMPTSIAGIFSSLLGISRDMVYNMFRDYYFGAILLNYKGKARETATLLQKKEKRFITTVAPTYILNEPEYNLYIAGDEESIHNIYSKILDGVYYMPYGGQNDYFPLDYRVKDIVDVALDKVVKNYAPSTIVERSFLDRGGEIYIAPVKYGVDDGEKKFVDFYFVYRGELHLNMEVYTVDGSALYKLSDFYYQVRG